MAGMCLFNLQKLSCLLRSISRFSLDREMCKGKCDGVQWELHFSCADDNKTIHDQLLNVRRIFNGEDKTKVSEPLPTSLIKGGLAWFRVS